MNDYYQQLGITLVTSALPCIIGGMRYRLLDLPSRIFYALLVLGFITELTGYYYVMSVEMNNMPIYNISALIQVLLMCGYFNYIIAKFRRRHIGWYIGFVSVVLGVLNTVYLQPLNTINTHYFHYQVLLLVVLSIIFIKNDLMPDIFENRIRWSVHFWLVFLLLNFALLNLISTGMYDFLVAHFKDTVNVHLFLVCLAGLFNVGFAWIFFICPKLKRNYDQR